MDEDWDQRELSGNRDHQIDRQNDRQVDRQINPTDPDPETPLVKMGFEEKFNAAQASAGEDLWELNAATTKILDFTTGRSLQQFTASEPLIAAVRALLAIAATAYRRLERAAPELARTLDAATLTADYPTDPSLHTFLRTELPGLLVRITTELETWHAG